MRRSKKAYTMTGLILMLIILVMLILLAVWGINKMKKGGTETVVDQYKCQNLKPYPGFCIDRSVQGGCAKYDATTKDTGFYEKACENKKETENLVCCVLDAGIDPIELVTFHIEGEQKSLKNHAQLDLIDYPNLDLSVVVPKYVYNYDNLELIINAPDDKKTESKCNPKSDTDEEERIAFSDCDPSLSLSLEEGKYKITVLGHKNKPSSTLFKKELTFHVVVPDEDSG